MERPQVIHHGGVYHLFFHCWGFHVNPGWARAYLPQGFDFNNRHSTLYHFEAAGPTGPYRPSPRSPVVPGTIEPEFALYGLHFVPLPPGATEPKEWLVLGWNRGR